MQFNVVRCCLITLAVVWTVCPPMHAAEHVTLRNGFELDCVRSEIVGNKVRLYLPAKGIEASNATNKDINYLEVSADAIVHIEMTADTPQPATFVKSEPAKARAVTPNKIEMREMLNHAGAVHHIDTDLLASVMKAESGGQVRAISRTGARGLMQLMPETANAMGVQDAFLPEQNIAGGTAYLDELLTRYHDDIALALAAYNAGPAAVDRYHGIPPYHETKAYVARVIREFNRRKQMALLAQAK